LGKNTASALLRLGALNFHSENSTFSLVFKLMLEYIFQVSKVKTSRGSEYSSRSMCHIGLYGECFILSAWLLNMKAFLAIKYNLLGETILFNFYDNIYNFGIQL
jgi:hypothetical protein